MNKIKIEDKQHNLGEHRQIHYIETKNKLICENKQMPEMSHTHTMSKA